MTTVTPDQVWESIKNDPEFASMPAETINLSQPYVMAMPEVLAGHLDKTVTLESYLAAKAEFDNYALENKMLERLYGDSDKASELVETLTTRLEQYDKVLSDVPAFLDEFGVTRKQLMLSPILGLNAQAQTRYQDGDLTIGELLVLQPMALYKYS